MELDLLDYIIDTYERTYDRCIKTGFGNKTKFGTVVTPNLLETLLERMNQLKAKRISLISSSTK